MRPPLPERIDMFVAFVGRHRVRVELRNDDRGRQLPHGRAVDPEGDGVATPLQQSWLGAPP
jgi:hypothetical protein